MATTSSASTAAADLDAFGFPTVHLSKRQQRRIKIRAFTNENHWQTQYPSVESAIAAAGTDEGRSRIRELSTLHGIIPAYRRDMYWAFCENTRLKQCGSAATSTYQELLARCSSIPVDVAKQIELDLPRTFCEQVDFKAASEANPSGGSRDVLMNGAHSPETQASLTAVGEGPIHDALRRMLCAFCVEHPVDTYLQSMNFIAGFMLLVFGREGEERAFWCFELLCAHMFAGYYTCDMATLRGDCDLLRTLLEERKPALSAHLMHLGGVDIAALFVPRWLLCMYLNCFPTDIVVRVWDAMITEGEEAPRLLLEVRECVFG